jgi:hypothetical protein
VQGLVLWPTPYTYIHTKTQNTDAVTNVFLCPTTCFQLLNSLKVEEVKQKSPNSVNTVIGENITDMQRSGRLKQQTGVN